MTCFLCAFVSVLTASVASFCYLLAFEDQVESGPVGQRAIHVSMIFIVITATWPTVAHWFYFIVGETWHPSALTSGFRFMSRLHWVSGTLVLSRIPIWGDPTEIREITMILIGLSLLGLAFHERRISRRMALAVERDDLRIYFNALRIH